MANKEKKINIKFKAKPYAKKYSETSIFNALCNFLIYFRQNCLTDMRKDDRLSYGMQYSHKIYNALLSFRRAYDSAESTLKVKYLTEVEEILKEIEAETLIFSKVQITHLSKCMECMKNIGSIMTSVDKFKKSCLAPKKLVSMAVEGSPGRWDTDAE